MKRNTDTEIWAQKWFRKLPPLTKLVWKFLKDRCDNAGVWETDYELADIYIGAAVDWEQAIGEINAEKERVLKIDHGKKLWLTGYIQFHNNVEIDELNPSNRFHAHIIALVKRHCLEKEGKKLGACKGLTTSLQGRKSKSISKGIGKSIDKSIGNYADEIYKAYPRHDAPKAAKKKIEVAIKEIALRMGGFDNDDRCVKAYSWLLDRTCLWAKACEPRDRQYIPHPATWYNQGRYDENPEDWIKDNEKPKGGFQKPTTEDLINLDRKEE